MRTKLLFILIAPLILPYFFIAMVINFYDSYARRSSSLTLFFFSFLLYIFFLPIIIIMMIMNWSSYFTTILWVHQNESVLIEWYINSGRERRRRKERERVFLSTSSTEISSYFIPSSKLFSMISQWRCVYKKKEKKTWWCTNTNINSFFPTHLMYASYPFLIRILFSQKKVH